MKLRNKKTGKIVTIGNRLEDDFDFVGLVFKVDHSNDTIEMDDRIEYHSLAELNEDWEDYKPAEPLIKDEKTRKVVRAWAECCCVPLLKHYFSNGFSCFICKDEEDNEYCLDFTFRIDNLAPEHIYTIAELCGEEKE